MSAIMSKRKSTSQRSSTAETGGFQFTPEQLQDAVDAALEAAKRLGATDAVAEASEGNGLSVSVRNQALENVERNRDKSLGVTVYLGYRRGHASTSDFSLTAITETVQAALDIARFTAEDPLAGLPDAEDVVTDIQDLDLFHPWTIDAQGAAELAMACEAAALQTSAMITNSEGAGVSAQHSHFFAAHMREGRTHGAGVFRGGYASTRHSLSVAPIAGKGEAMQRDHWYTSMRDAREMATPEAVGRYAAERALARLNGRRLKTMSCPVLFEAPLASGLLGAFVQGVSGGALYRNASFLQDSLGKQVFAKHVDIDEDPFVLKGKGSSPFDDEGVRVQARRVLDAGRVKGYFLSSYSARKLGMKTTGHSGGSHNLVMSSRLTKDTDKLPEMLKKLHRGFFVTELMGHGVNGVTGDYSRGASGYWVENGEIAYPVEEVTIAGNLKTMFKNIDAIGADAYNLGAKTCGSVLISAMKVAGA